MRARTNPIPGLAQARHAPIRQRLDIKARLVRPLPCLSRRTLTAFRQVVQEPLVAKSRQSAAPSRNHSRAVILDSRVVMAARGGSSEASAWPPAEERFASDFLDAAPVATPWLAELTQAAAESDLPFLLGGHALVSDGLRILVDAAWLGR